MIFPYTAAILTLPGGRRAKSGCPCAGAGLALVVAAAKPAAAQDGDFLAFSLGAFDFINETTTEARIEYRSGWKTFNVGPTHSG